ncbi:MAG TPA: imidazole glycerol phosphate synthase subunit HisH [Candidatus Limnocylindria bacterium]|nr:imidazole glycerol phosphate synthase subunit HisH [Candidatus Limnocylindria bacterium]
MIAIVDYGVGNLANLERALRRAGASDVRVTRSHVEILAARAVVLPGVGHFGHCARELRRFGLDAMVRVARDRGVPLLGLCVGMQLFFEESEEDPGTPGLGFERGRVRRLRGDVRVPHTGWNRVALSRSHSWLADVPDGAYFYFVHSYAAQPEDPRAVVATVDHGGTVVAATGEGTLLGLQFHPEKSGAMGLRALRGFVRAAAA